MADIKDGVKPELQLSLRDYFAAHAISGIIYLEGLPADKKVDELWNKALAKEAY